jgi:hypothetical protein
MPEVWFQMVEPTVISTFAGCGGSSLGYKLAGFRELLAVEWDDNSVETFRLNFPGVPVYHGDIAKLTGAECMRLAGLNGPGVLDVLDGSPPCQGFSTAGKRKFDDPRNSLFREYARLLKELQPRVFVMDAETSINAFAAGHSIDDAIVAVTRGTPEEITMPSMSEKLLRRRARNPCSMTAYSSLVRSAAVEIRQWSSNPSSGRRPAAVPPSSS